MGGGLAMVGFAIFLFLLMDCIDAVLASAQESSDPLTPLERSRLEKEEKIDNRIRIYETVSTRWMRSVNSLVQIQEFDELPATLEAWSELLSLSARDVEKAVNRKKKSRALIRYEIHLRQAIGEIRDLRHRIPVHHQDAIDAWVNRAAEIRKRLLDILFELSSCPDTGRGGQAQIRIDGLESFHILVWDRLSNS
jgi:hypothetical protein